MVSFEIREHTQTRKHPESRNIKMKVSKKFDKRYNIKKYQFIRNYANQNKIESIWKHKEENKVLIVN